MRLACVGDSFTEGVADDLRRDGEYLGWADRVAAQLAGTREVQYANLAVRGKLLDQVVAEQVGPALALKPDILTFHAGGNDVLRRGTELSDLFARYDAAVAGLGATERTVVLFTCLTRAGGSSRFADLIASRFEAFNDNVREVGARYGALVVEIDAVPALSDRRLWHSDRLHLNAEGHRRVAAAVLERLAVPDPAGRPGWWREPLPVVARRGRMADAAGDVRWVGEHLAPWVWRRVRGVSSGDGRHAKQPELRVVQP